MRYSLERRRKLGPKSIWRWREHRAPRLRADFPSVPLVHTPERENSHSSEGLERGVFRFLNQTRELGQERPDWRLGSVGTDRLWTITLHYHAWAYDLARAATAGGTGSPAAAASFHHYLSDWMARCSLETPGARDLAWNAYAIATRLGWWIRAYRLLKESYFPIWNGFEQSFLSSLWEQAAYLRDHLEWDLRANHLLRDAVGLAWAGRLFQEDRAAEWLKTTTRLAIEQAVEQVLPDGGHFERSPMYHLHVMEDILSLVLLLEEEEAGARLREVWSVMAETLAWLRHPDGDLLLFNDGGLQGGDRVEHMLQLGSRIGVSAPTQARRGGRHFHHTGLVVWHGDPWTVFFDVGTVGPDYQPGHAHADTLSVECSYRGSRLIVDPGTYGYDNDDHRRYDRSTAAHNTVCLDGQDSSEVWHIFRVGRRAYPLDVEVNFTDSGMTATASHNGYDHLPGRPRHTRRLETDRDGRLILTDSITGRGRHLVQGGFLLSPEWTAQADAGGWILRNGVDAVRLTVRGPQELALSEERRPYHPEYGREFQTTRLSWRVYCRLPAEVQTFIEGA
jgi:uncharacterized heparinase superfamily protein